MITKGAIFTGNVKASNVISHNVNAKKHAVNLPENHFVDMGIFIHGNNITDTDLQIINNITHLLSDLKHLSADGE